MNETPNNFWELQKIFSDNPAPEEDEVRSVVGPPPRRGPFVASEREAGLLSVMGIAALVIAIMFYSTRE